MNDIPSIDSLAPVGVGLLVAAAAITLGTLSATRPLAGVAGYILFGGPAAIIRFRRDAGTVGDSRPRTPAESTLTLIGLASAVVFPALVAADGLGYYSWTPVTVGIAVSVAVLYAVYGVVTAGHRIRGQPA
jgi:hypothetical protein